jgi:hypothetical protein
MVLVVSAGFNSWITLFVDYFGDEYDPQSIRIGLDKEVTLKRRLKTSGFD